MAQAQEPQTGQKRGVGRPPGKTSTPLAKKPRLSTSTSTQAAPAVQSPVISTPTTEKKSGRVPTRIFDSKPLPTLPEPQPVLLSGEEYQSIAASAVLASSLERSRVKWTIDGVFERYWVKPESGKSAKPPPPNNPEAKWMKSKGECRIRVEPHIFKCEMYVEEKPMPKQHPPPAPYRPPHQHQPYGQQYQQGRPLPPVSQPQQSRQLPPMNQQQQGRTLPPINRFTNSPSTAPTSTPLRAPPAPSPSHPAVEKKANSPDPVISALAARASSDPQLKTLMKEVATGNATPEQLKIFQRHIDELQNKIKEQKRKDEEDEKRQREADTMKQAQAEVKPPIVDRDSEVIQYDGAGDSKMAVPQPYTPHTASPAHHHHATPRAYPPQSVPQQPWTPPPPPERPVLLQFMTPGATDDRFLFPRYSVLETLGAQHLLASFIITRKGHEAVDSSKLDPSKEYWIPLTVMLEVPLESEALLEHVRKWVKPAAEVQTHMNDIMKRAERAPDTYLALRLPFKGSTMAETEDLTSKEATPAGSELERPKPKSSVKYVKKATIVTKPAESASVKKESIAADKPPDKPATTTKPADAEADQKPKEASNGEPAVTESGRPKRAVRQSARISDAS